MISSYKRSGRPEKPISSVGGGPIVELAAALRRLRNESGLTYRQLAALTGYRIPTLSAAASGTRLPSRDVTSTWVRACHGDERSVLALWERAYATMERPTPESPGLTGRPPRPGRHASPADFVHEMRRLKVWAGDPSLTTLNHRSRGELPPSTVSEALRKDRLPRRELAVAFARACGLEDDEIREWERSWNAIQAREMGLAGPTDGISYKFRRITRSHKFVMALCVAALILSITSTAPGSMSAVFVKQAFRSVTMFHAVATRQPAFPATPGTPRRSPTPNLAPARTNLSGQAHASPEVQPDPGPSVTPKEPAAIAGSMAPASARPSFAASPTPSCPSSVFNPIRESTSTFTVAPSVRPGYEMSTPQPWPQNGAPDSGNCPVYTLRPGVHLHNS
jgi:hypothetical protein